MTHKNKPKTIKKMVIGTFLEHKWIKCSNQKTQTG